MPNPRHDTRSRRAPRATMDARVLLALRVSIRGREQGTLCADRCSWECPEGEATTNLRSMGSSFPQVPIARQTIWRHDCEGNILYTTKGSHRTGPTHAFTGQLNGALVGDTPWLKLALITKITYLSPGLQNLVLFAKCLSLYHPSCMQDMCLDKLIRATCAHNGTEKT